MEESEPPSPNLLASFRRIADTVLSTLQNRVELFAVELQEQKFWLISTLIWTAAAIFFGVLAVTMVTVTVVHLCPAKARPFVLVGLCLVYIVLAWRAVTGLKRQLNAHSPPMAETLNELKKDVAWLKSRETK